MKGLAPAETLTGMVQREIQDGWAPAFLVAKALRLEHKKRTVEACLERLVREGRAERQVFAATFEYRGVAQ